mmetsp:Transcript_26179/g.65949  ORF Transcript_26179/g.65949 Transcript_26179/m.65949 type:complete len:249 (+) Transcript_26179:2159-2905(+)
MLRLVSVPTLQVLGITVVCACDRCEFCHACCRNVVVRSILIVRLETFAITSNAGRTAANRTRLPRRHGAVVCRTAGLVRLLSDIFSGVSRRRSVCYIVRLLFVGRVTQAAAQHLLLVLVVVVVGGALYLRVIRATVAGSLAEKSGAPRQSLCAVFFCFLQFVGLFCSHLIHVATAAARVQTHEPQFDWESRLELRLNLLAEIRVVKVLQNIDAARRYTHFPAVERLREGHTSSAFAVLVVLPKEFAPG